MKRLAVILIMISLTACSTLESVKEMIPSRWDANQSKVITDLQLNTRRFDCSQPLISQLDSVDVPLTWLNLYSETKGTKDILKLTETFNTTFKEFKDRIKAGPVSAMYCDLKKKILIQQADAVAKAVQGRF